MISGEPSRCKGCGGPIHWVELGTGKRHPVNPSPNAAGTIARIEGVWRVLRGSDQTRGVVRYVSHFATCPNARDFRGGSR
jgi:hypothetical protein